MSISVIIPTYNRASVLPRCLNSVMNQARPADEVIVVDDGSDDDTADIILNNYNKIIYLKQNHQGVSCARNTGIKHAKGDWLAFLDSDDEWLSNKLSRQLEELDQQPGFQIVHNDEIWVRNDKRVNPKKKHQKHGGDIFEQCLALCCISPSAVMIHREVFDNVGLFDEGLPACEDYDLWLRICCLYPVLFINEKLIRKYGGHSDQLSNKYWGMDRFRIYALHKLIHSGSLNKQQVTLAESTLQQKLNVVITGAKKHNNQELIKELNSAYCDYL